MLLYKMKLVCCPGVFIYTSYVPFDFSSCCWLAVSTRWTISDMFNRLQSICVDRCRNSSSLLMNMIDMIG
ncbi:hypothetical protein LSH36_153g00072 [Paralvinella palmiformis]|uniref:Uncharacterized protein n=1 Tax=Paralvinella palmiformis TaxID=53620 RepID=A0AAD9N6Y8_9ANNE|nr:hypothetical protein LSH36_153g00072 [Paralvinella palmiformis]